MANQVSCHSIKIARLSVFVIFQVLFVGDVRKWQLRWQCLFKSIVHNINYYYRPWTIDYYAICASSITCPFSHLMIREGKARMMW